MKLTLVLCVGLALFACFETTQAWSGPNICSRTYGYYARISYCRCWGWWGCLYWGWVWRYRYRTDRFCCPGWRHNGNQVCNIPICSPSCMNGGTCIRPNVCDCRDGYTGSVCGGLEACSHLYPCYPGRCYGNNQCMCSEGFSGTTCDKFEDSEYKPVIEKGNATFAKYLYTQNNRMLYLYMTDATNSSSVDYVWTNQPEFNEMKFDIDASIDARYVFQHVPPLPDYIRNQKFGIVAARVLIQHYKLDKDLNEYLVNDETFQCPGLTNTAPLADNDILECRLTNGTNVFQVDSGDRYVLTYTITSGGYRELINTNNNQLHATQIYTGLSSEMIMEFRFDRDVPLHCSESQANTVCDPGSVAFELEKDITREALKPKWAGWNDTLSGIARYSFEVWKMEYSQDYDVLREPDIRDDINPVPDYIISIEASNNIVFPTYKPTVPGMYSTILEIVDNANNSRFARRLVIFDDSSEITTRNEYPMIVLTASNKTNYAWQTTPNTQNQQETTIQITWENHFVNEVHENDHTLKGVQKYEPRLSDDIERTDYKKIEDKFDDTDGKRTLGAISNVNSIVQFEYNIGSLSTSVPSIGWVNAGIDQIITKTLTGENVFDGDERQIWVRAKDIMGNTKVDSVILNFDNTPPQIFSDEIEIQKNVKGQDYPFASRVTVGAKDEHSAVSKVAFRFKVKSTGEVKTTQEFEISPNGQTACSSSTCYCLTISGTQYCYDTQTTLEINNCWLRVPIDRVGTDEHVLDIIVYNSAMLSTTESIDLGTVNTFHGIHDYQSPSNITIHKTLDTSLSISWIQAPTCYERAGILIRLFSPGNKTRDFKVHKDAISFDLTGLEPTTNYWFQLFTKYGNDTDFVMSSSPGILTFQTAEASVGFPPAGVAGLSVGFIVIILVVVVVLVFLGRTGRLQPAKAKMIEVRRNFTVRKRTNTRRVDGYNNRAYSTKFDDDIYYYGQMENKINNMVLSRKDIALESELTHGKFATIYLAKYYGNQRDAQTVVAKVLRDDQSEENVIKMKAKINFYSDRVGEHKNVVKFIGAIMDDTARGPFMVFEYCENGVLKDFLQGRRSNVTVDLEERLFRMCYGVCLGMDYLASQKVVHRRLAARNILLDHLYEPKIAGFGPDPGTEQDGDERLPLKWMAPECQKTTRDADELSDVFSFGVVMWEIFTLGETPYPEVQSRDVLKKQKQGYKMKKPEYCDDEFYKIMLKCWHYDPRNRCGFAQLKKDLDSLFQTGPSDDYYYRTNDLE